VMTIASHLRLPHELRLVNLFGGDQNQQIRKPSDAVKTPSIPARESWRSGFNRAPLLLPTESPSLTSR
jgi:hypothetical protein